MCRFGVRQKALLVTCLMAVSKMPEQTTLGRRRLLLAVWLGRFRSMVFGSIDVGPVVKAELQSDGGIWKRSSPKGRQGVGVLQEGIEGCQPLSINPGAYLVHLPIAYSVLNPQVPHWVRAQTF